MSTSIAIDSTSGFAFPRRETASQTRSTPQPLNDLPHGIRAQILAIDSRDETARRLMEMGVLPGAVVRVVKSAPLGCPLEIEVRGYRLALRRAEAQHVSVVEIAR